MKAKKLKGDGRSGSGRAGRSLAVKTAKPRPERPTGQFEISAFCPKTERIAGGSTIGPAFEPFPVWVYLDTDQPTSNCKGKSYTLTPESYRDMYRRGFRWNPAREGDRAVCEHMGRLIE